MKKGNEYQEKRKKMQEDKEKEEMKVNYTFKPKL
jgi:hypothetical protein